MDEIRAESVGHIDKKITKKKIAGSLNITNMNTRHGYKRKYVFRKLPNNANF